MPRTDADGRFEVAGTWHERATVVSAVLTSEVLSELPAAWRRGGIVPRVPGLARTVSRAAIGESQEVDLSTCRLVEFSVETNEGVPSDGAVLTVLDTSAGFIPDQLELRTDRTGRVRVLLVMGPADRG